MNAATTHPPRDDLQAYGLGRLDDSASENVRQHLEVCDACRSQVASLSADSLLEQLRKANGPITTPPPGKPLHGLSQVMLGRGEAPAPAVEDVPPELVKQTQYEIIRQLGAGGMGVVYLAKNKLMDRLEVLKVIGAEMLKRPGARERFLREIRSAAALNHENVVKAHSAMELGSLLVFAMEYADGEELAKVVKSQGPLPVANACHYARQVALGLQHAYEKEMVHRDIKPHNLILMRDGKKHVVKILDFGLAKATSEFNVATDLTGEGRMLGTPDYMAPEQGLDAAAAKTPADIYSLGCTLYFLLSGRPPFRAPGLSGLLMAHQITTAESLNLLRPEVPAELAAIVAKMMAKDPAKRYQKPLEVAQALLPFITKTGIKAAGAAATPSISVGEKPKAKPEPIAKPVAAPAAVAKAAVATQIEAAPVGAAKAEVSPFTFAPEPAAPKPALKKAVSKGPKLGKPLLWIGLALSAVLIGLLAWGAGVVFRVQVKDGVIVIQVNEPNPEVYVDGEKITVTWANGGKKAEISLKAGTRQISLKKDGFVVHGEEVTINDGDRKILTAQLARTMVIVPPEDDFVPLFNGKDLTGWKTLPGRPNAWKVVNGAITSSGPLSYLFHERGDFTDFNLRVEARTGSNSGSVVFCRALYDNARADKWGTPFGFATIISGGPIEGATGSLYQIARTSKERVKAGEWFVLEIVAQGSVVSTYVDGEKILETTISASLRRGHFALQQHSAKQMVEFRSVAVKELTKVKAKELTKTPDAPTPPVPNPSVEKPGEIGRFEGHTAGVNYVTFSRDGRQALSASWDRTVRLWNVAEHRELQVFQGHSQSVWRVNFSSDGLEAISGCADATCRFWDLKTGKERTQLLDPTPGSTAFVAVSPATGQALALNETKDKQYSLALWDTKERRELHRFNTGFQVWNPVFSPDGKRVLYSGGVTHIELWDTEKRSAVRRLQGHTGAIPAVAFSDDGSHALSGSWDKTLIWWDLANGKALRTLVGHEKEVICVAVSPDGKHALSGSQDQTVRLWNLETGEEIGCLKGHSGTIKTVAFSPDGQHALSGSDDKTIRLWRLPLKAPIPANPAPKSANASKQAEANGLGAWQIKGDEIEQIANGKSGTSLLAFGDPTWRDIDYQCEAFFVDETSLPFRFVDSTNYYYLRWIDGYNPTLAQVNKGAPPKFLGIASGKIEAGWHKILLKLRGDDLQCYSDGKLMISARDAGFQQGRVGLRARAGSASRFRNIKVTDPTGKVLWEGLPEMPGAGPPEIKESKPAVIPQVKGPAQTVIPTVKTPPAVGVVVKPFYARDFTGWNGLARYWRIENGALVGRCPPNEQVHTFLISKKPFKDFELTFKARLKDGVGNSGVNFRSVVVDPKKFQVRGMQCDIARGLSGGLYGEAMGGLIKAAPPDFEKFFVRDKAFNEFHIKVVGKHVAIKVNGAVSVDDDFPTMAAEGVIAWQINAGLQPCEVTFKDIVLIDLSRPAPIAIVVAKVPVNTRPKLLGSKLIDALKDVDLEVRYHAAIEIGDIGPSAKQAVPNLVKLLTDKKEEPKVRLAAAVALSRIGPVRAAADAVPRLLELLSDAEDDPDVRCRATWALRRAQPISELRASAGVCPGLLIVLKEPETIENRMLRYECAYMLSVLQANSAAGEVLDVLLDFLKDTTVQQYDPTKVAEQGAGAGTGKGDGRKMAVDALTAIGRAKIRERPDLVQQVELLAGDPTTNQELRDACTKFLSDIGGQTKDKK